MIFAGKFFKREGGISSAVARAALGGPLISEDIDGVGSAVLAELASTSIVIPMVGPSEDARSNMSIEFTSTEDDALAADSLLASAKLILFGTINSMASLNPRRLFLFLRLYAIGGGGRGAVVLGCTGGEDTWVACAMVLFASKSGAT